MKESLNAIPAGAIVVLHSCCHNPTGVDLTNEQWTEVLEIVTRAAWCRSSTSPAGIRGGPGRRRLRGAPVRHRHFAGFPVELVLEIVLALRRARRRAQRGDQQPRGSGARAVPGQAHRAHQLLQPPDARQPDRRHRARQSAAAQPWDRELGEMRERIKEMRKQLVESVQSRVPGYDFSFVLKQRGMFSYSASARSRCAACARKSRSTPSTPAASAWLRSLEERRLRRRCHRRGNSVKFRVLPDPR